ncbi:MAG TPA: AI-2E family transporter [Acidimicrobiales bacterium]|nr:AI-2E family transporter [Acidimicrobiales bacterium]
MAIDEKQGPAPASTWRDLPGPLLRLAGEYGWRLIVVGFVFYWAVILAHHLTLVVVPFLIALLVTALLSTPLRWLRHRGLGRGLATLATILLMFIVLGGILALVIVRAAEQAPQLGNEINNLLPHIKHWLITGPLHLNAKSVNNLSQTITNNITKNSSKIASTALTTGREALNLVAGFLLVVFSTIFLLYDGQKVWSYVVKIVPPAARDRADAAGHAAWTTLSHYVRGTLVVAAFHGVVMAITLTLLGVPLAFPLAVVIALGSFVPLVGAVLTGVLAIAIAGLAKGLVAAIIVFAVLIIDGQIEGHILQPFVVGRYVRVHPLAVVLALGAGGLLFGIFGAVVAVPFVACINSGVQAAKRLSPAGTPHEGGEIPPAGG